MLLLSEPVLRVGEGYVGRVSEGGGRVEVEPPIRADNGPICGYRILATHTPNIPFQVSKPQDMWRDFWNPCAIPILHTLLEKI